MTRINLRDRISLLGDLPPWVWLLAMVVTTAGCESISIGDGPVAGSLVAALGSFAYALRVRVTSDARTQGAVIEALTRRDNEIAQLREAHRTDLAQVRLAFEAALGREQLAVKRLDALAEEFETWREEHGLQRSRN